ncbi:hypothetical protein SAMN04244572_02390 [Azotobacter beijerinckii]|uniref:Uncharacterized protein n=1 Tax=Azotobacter beijerinckii TaxID=170623 RepID=A0A1H9TP70_9GAMM|nr:hypothetical protein [Azotobacter beijerinckii]SEI99802.1 hypothetical protein SAMN04244572_02390 [Azotobacter beijerinckii]SER98976.1 hypothetical protein SAMN04244573_04698 [Azotobacter beijerinckii]
MGEVVEFPVHDRTLQQTESWVVKICMKEGLTREMALEVAAEYQLIHENLFDMEKSKLSIPPEAALSDQQVAAIIPAVRNLYVGQLARAAHIIIGLLAREKLKLHS